MPVIYIDADACPVKEEVYRVAKRYGVRVVVVANAIQRVPTDPPAELVVRVGFGAADDYIAEVVRPGDVTVTADIPLAARCVAAGGVVVDPRGNLLDASTIGEAVAMRDLMTDLREAGSIGGGPRPMAAKDKSRFSARLDETVVAVRRAYPG